MVYRRLISACLLCCLGLPSVAQQDPSLPNPSSSNPNSVVPLFSRFSGMLKDLDGKPLSEITGVTFALYKDSEGGSPLWQEVQNVRPNQGGQYTVTLGSTSPEGLPPDLFATGDARWLGVQINGQPENPRVLLMSVPYALKALDAETLGGRPVSDFALANGPQLTTNAGSTAILKDAATMATTTTNPAVTGAGTAGYIPVWDSASDIIDSPLFVSGADVGIGTATPTAALDVNGTTLLNGALTVDGSSTLNGVLELAPTGAATASASFDSQMLKLYSSAFNSSSASVVNPRFEWQAEPHGNDTAAPTATLNLLSSTTSSGATETGFSLNANGTINFATGQTFPGVLNAANTFTASQTVKGTVTATAFSGSGAAVTNVNAALLNGLAASAFAQLGANANFGQVGIGTTTPAALLDVEGSAGASGISGSNATQALQVVGGKGGSAETGSGGGGGGLTLTGGAGGLSEDSGGGSGGGLTLTGGVGGLSETNSGGSGGGLTLTGGVGGSSEDSGGGGGGSMTLTGGVGGSSEINSGGSGGGITLQPGAGGHGYSGYGPAGNVLLAPNGGLVGIGTTTPAYMLDVSNGDAVVRGANNFTTSGNTTHLYVGDTNHAVVATNASGIGFSTFQKPNALWVQDSTGFVGIGTTSAGHLLTLVQGGGSAMADGWNTYSSRRWKTNIHTLTGALEKVERLRGVSYELKGNGKHEVGVIAEEVGAVVPEIVTWEKNGKDAQGVDYSRLTALLIEATKEQQTLIRQQQKQIKAQQSQIKAEQTQIKAEQAAARVQQAEISRLTKQVTTIQAVLKQSGRTDSGVLTASASTFPPRP
jgi:Chaperone of endosialidase